jgi:hypothetical protein
VKLGDGIQVGLLVVDEVTANDEINVLLIEGAIVDFVLLPTVGRADDGAFVVLKVGILDGLLVGAMVDSVVGDSGVSTVILINMKSQNKLTE